MRNGSILLVEDDVELLAALQGTLTRAGFEVVSQQHANDAIRWLACNDRWFDLVITDVTMPGTDGLTLLEAIKDKFAAVPIIVMTAMGDSDHYLQARQLGAAAFLRKPFQRADLLQTVRRTLANQNLQPLAAH